MSEVRITSDSTVVLTLKCEEGHNSRFVMDSAHELLLSTEMVESDAFESHECSVCSSEDVREVVIHAK